MKTKGHKDTPHFPNKIRMDASWLQQHMPAGRCLICGCAVGAKRIVCRGCARELEGVKNINVGG